MRRPHPVRSLLTCALAATVAAGGCGPESQTSTLSDTVSVYSAQPLQGPGAQRSRDVVDGEKLALAQARGEVGDFSVNFRSLDDSDPEAGGWEREATVDAARIAAQDRNTIAYLGDFESEATALSLPVLNAAGVTQASPGATYGA